MDLEIPTRNNYFYGRLLGVDTFKAETGYFLQQSRRYARLAAGHGVVCGLDVTLTKDGGGLRISPGLAVDGWGRQVVVPERSPRIEVPQDTMAAVVDRAAGCADDARIRVVLRYHECLGDPVPVYAGNCDDPDPCLPGTVREGYRIEFREEAPRPPASRPPHDLVRHGRVDHAALARWVTRDCRARPHDPCVPLADVQVTDDLRCAPDGVDITVRPIAPTNRVLLALLTALVDDLAD
ncbi:hypothetical protein [Sphaerisporangium rhizosphaerae]|uniref:Uncharacterized protein n=1 Tax=Sphaerisporangium rhizosphaerae TaxID=2269375 RepID=A0ABW2PKV8_9ACTN